MTIECQIQKAKAAAVLASDTFEIAEGLTSPEQTLTVTFGVALSRQYPRQSFSEWLLAFFAPKASFSNL